MHNRLNFLKPNQIILLELTILTLQANVVGAEFLSPNFTNDKLLRLMHGHTKPDRIRNDWFKDLFVGPNSKIIS